VKRPSRQPLLLEFAFSLFGLIFFLRFVVIMVFSFNIFCSSFRTAVIPRHLYKSRFCDFGGK
jgi:hypothetical protein